MSYTFFWYRIIKIRNIFSLFKEMATFENLYFLLVPDYQNKKYHFFI